MYSFCKPYFHGTITDSVVGVVGVVYSIVVEYSTGKLAYNHYILFPHIITYKIFPVNMCTEI
jgi:hypothetical protein